MINILLLIVGLLLILGGANYLTDGAAGLARRFGLSDLTIGLTIVAFGTSAPELTISLMAAINGSGGMAVGNVVGSNIFNVLMIVGVVALCRPIKIQPTIMTNEIPLAIVAALAVVAMGLSPVLDSTPAVVSRVEGIMLLLFLAIFMRYVQASSHDGVEQSESPTLTKRPGVAKGVLMTVGGLAALVWGGDIFVDSASALARMMGISDAVIGLTIVAVGTSLPELATSVAAALKGNTGIAVGNVIGSNILNVFLVLGVSATVAPLSFGGVGVADLAVLLGSVVLFWVFGWKFKERTITRWEGSVMAACYVGYTAFLVVNAI